jgi:hypothetical protein
MGMAFRDTAENLARQVAIRNANVDKTQASEIRTITV